MVGGLGHPEAETDADGNIKSRHSNALSLPSSIGSAAMRLRGGVAKESQETLNTQIERTSSATEIEDGLMDWMGGERWLASCPRTNHEGKSYLQCMAQGVEPGSERASQPAINQRSTAQHGAARRSWHLSEQGSRSNIITSARPIDQRQRRIIEEQSCS